MSPVMTIHDAMIYDNALCPHKFDMPPARFVSLHPAKVPELAIAFSPTTSSLVQRPPPLQYLPSWLPRTSWSSEAA